MMQARTQNPSNFLQWERTIMITSVTDAFSSVATVTLAMPWVVALFKDGGRLVTGLRIGMCKQQPTLPAILPTWQIHFICECLPRRLTNEVYLVVCAMYSSDIELPRRLDVRRVKLGWISEDKARRSKYNSIPHGRVTCYRIGYTPSAKRTRIILCSYRLSAYHRCRVGCRVQNP
ncbi:hypothetical protein DFH29DRAFT_590705 [Suillus ampliporus]|nr:hypothetical protein DFH29DRAFT_590705 [Suillus ampliporus]